MRHRPAGLSNEESLSAHLFWGAERDFWRTKRSHFDTRAWLGLDQHMKILFATTVAVTHEMFLLPYARHFRAQGWRVDGAAAGITDSQECRKSYDHTFEMPWSRNPLNPRNLIAAVGRIRALAKNGNYDIVHVHTPVAAYITRCALGRMKYRLGLKVVYTAHGFHFHPGGNPVANVVFLALEKSAGRLTDRLIVINRSDWNSALIHGIVPSEHVIHIPGIGVELKDYDPARVNGDSIDNFRSSISLNRESPLFLMVAEFHSGKRHIDALKAFQGVRADAHLAFAGTGTLLGKIEDQARRMGIEKRIHFLGYRKDIPILMRSSVATILPSVREGLARSVMESMCLGTPVIGTDIRGIRELLEKGGGILVPPRSPIALSMAMNWVLDHRDEAKAMGRKGRENMADYNLARVLRLHEELYEGLLSEHPAPAVP